MNWQSELWALPIDSWYSATIGGYILIGCLLSFAILVSGALIQFVGVSPLTVKVSFWTIIVSLIPGYAGDIYLYSRQDQFRLIEGEDVALYDRILELKQIVLEAVR